MIPVFLDHTSIKCFAECKPGPTDDGPAFDSSESFINTGNQTEDQNKISL
jgi:hypothetical protein